MPTRHITAPVSTGPWLKVCPFCGQRPTTGPEKCWEEGNAWAFVACTNTACPAKPRIAIHDERGTDYCLLVAERLWNTRYLP